MAGLEFDFTDLLQLGDDLERAPESLPRRVRQAVEVTSRNVKDSARGKVRGRKLLGQAAAAIDYELTGSSGDVSGISAEIGYQKGGVGDLGNLVEFGAPGGTHPIGPGGELQDALAENADDLEQGVTKAVSDALREAGL